RSLGLNGPLFSSGGHPQDEDFLPLLQKAAAATPGGLMELSCSPGDGNKEQRGRIKLLDTVPDLPNPPKTKRTLSLHCVRAAVKQPPDTPSFSPSVKMGGGQAGIESARRTEAGVVEDVQEKELESDPGGFTV
ncbi:hypothetical protein KUCAC02_004922, partial [Chaenocephalus aceratus]